MSKDTSEPAKTNARGFGPLSAVFVVIGSFIVIPTFAQIVLAFAPALLGWDDVRSESWGSDDPLANFLFVLLTEALTIAALYKFSHYRHLAFRVVAALGRPRWRDVGYSALGLLVYFGISMVVLQAAGSVFDIDTEQKQALGFQAGVGGVGLLLAFAGLVILPPIAEEIMFRGFFFGAVRQKLRLWPTILITSGLFASLHLFGGDGNSLLWVAFIDVFCLSLVLCYLREQTGTIWSSMGVHALKNGFVFLYLFIIGGH